MEKVQILVVCAHADILETVLRLINNHDGWGAVGADSVESAIRIFHLSGFDLVLLGSGISSDSEARMRSVFLLQDPAIKIIQHFGGGSGLLASEIQAALDSLENGNFMII